MKYIDNQDGTFSVQAWLFTSPAFSGYLYTQETLLNKMGECSEYEAKMVWLLRDHKPLLGKEIARR